MRLHVAWLVGLVVGACFSEPFEYHCDRGEKGCACNDGLCLSGLECKEGHCVLPGCTRAEKFCNCDDGDCNAHLVCWEGSVCVPDDGSEGSAGTSSATGDAETGSETVASSVDSSGSETGACSCPACHTCDDSGACVVDVGASCEGDALECSDFLFGYEEGVCYRLAAGSVSPTCGADGTCRAATPQQCASKKGEAAVECDDGCVDAPELCDTYDPASTVDLETLCVTRGPGPGCGDTCFNGSGSELYHNACMAGHCTTMSIEGCNAYACEDLMCRTDCVDGSDCAQLYFCSMGTCTG